MKNKCKVICEIFQILKCGCEMREAMIFAVMNAIYAIVYIKKPLKSQDLKGV